MSYGPLSPDIALLQYGFILHGEQPEEALALSKVDEKGMTREDVSTGRVHSPPPPKLTGGWRGRRGLPLVGFVLGSVACRLPFYYHQLINVAASTPINPPLHRQCRRLQAATPP